MILKLASRGSSQDGCGLTSAGAGFWGVGWSKEWRISPGVPEASRLCWWRGRGGVAASVCVCVGEECMCVCVCVCV